MALANGNAHLHGLGEPPFWDGENVLIEGRGYKFRLDGSSESRSHLLPDNINIVRYFSVFPTLFFLFRERKVEGVQAGNMQAN